MKRRLISQRDSFTLTLPKEWVKSQNLISGDEINLEISDDILIINALEKESKREHVLDVTNLSDVSIRNILNGLYCLSATKITVNSSKSSKLLLCKKISSLFLVGFEVTEEDKNKIVLEALAIPSQDSFDKFFLKLFNFLEDGFDLLSEFPNKKKIEKLDEVKRDTKKLTQYSNICKRILSTRLMNNSNKAILLEIISYLLEINHLIFHIFDKEIKVNNDVKVLRSAFLGIRKGYFKKDLDELNNVQKELLDSYESFVKNSYIFSISRNLYGFSNSVLKLIF